MAKNKFEYINLSDVKYGNPVDTGVNLGTFGNPLVNSFSLNPDYSINLKPENPFTLNLDNSNQGAKSLYKALIKGVVKSEDGELLPEASLSYVDPTTKITTGVTTDFYGNFNVNIPVNTAVKVDFLGYDSQTFNSSSFPETVVLKGGNAAQLPEIEMTFKNDKTKNAVKYGAIGLGVLTLTYLLFSGSKTKSSGLKAAEVTI